MSMIIGCPKETKNFEGRVGLTPAGVQELATAGNTVLIEASAGKGSGIPDAEYVEAGAKIVSGRVVFEEAEMIIKVKEPIGEEIGLLREGQILFTYLHLAADSDLTRRLLERKIIGIGYETVEALDGSLPLLAPMSIIAGRLAPQVGATCLQSDHTGSGVLLGGAPGILPAEVVILGAGNVGSNAAKIAAGMGAQVTVVGMADEALRLDHLANAFHVNTQVMEPHSIAEMIKRADLLICGVLVKGARAPRLVTREMVKSMKPGSAIVDVSVDQGGCAETSHPTSHACPTYVVDDVIHYCVTNMPGIVARTSTFALANATLPYVLRLANSGCKKALLDDGTLQKGVNIYRGKLVKEAVAKSLNLGYTPLTEALSGNST